VLIAGAACGGSDPIIIKTGSWIGELNSQTTVERDELHAVLDLRIEAGVIAGTYEASGTLRHLQPREWTSSFHARAARRASRLQLGQHRDR
jgi:hypothetical protein